MAKTSKKNQGQEKDALGRARKEEAVTMTPDKIREFSAIFREPERRLLAQAEKMEEAGVEEIQSLVQGIHTSLERIESLILTQFEQKIQKASLKLGQKNRRKFSE